MDAYFKLTITDTKHLIIFNASNRCSENNFGKVKFEK